MRPTILPSDYADPEVFRAEQARLFDDWVFVGFGRQLARNNDYLAREVGGKSVVVQNFDGELRAFLNVCSHRFCRIRADGEGNRVLQCPYHGWTYDQRGVPFGIPKRPRFPELEDPAATEAFALERWRVATCGELVFVRRRLGGPELADYLGDARGWVEPVGSALGEQIDRNEILIKANWKVLVENTLESYHVGFVHPKTFGRLGASGMEFAFQGPHSSWAARLSDDMTTKWQRVAPVLAARPVHVDGYFHQLIFPNVTIATTHGATFALQVFDPIAPDLTRFVSHVFASQLADGSPRANAVLRALGQSAVEFNRQVFAEDAIVCELVQTSVEHAPGPGILSDEEERVLAFQAAYAHSMNRAGG